MIKNDQFVAMHVSLLAEDASATSIIMANTEADAVAAVHQQKPDVILSDMRLLEGTGANAVARIRTDRGAMPERDKKLFSHSNRPGTVKRQDG